MTSIYNKSLSIVKGMSAKGPMKCYNYLKTYNETGVIVLKTILELIINGGLSSNFKSSNNLNSVSDYEPDDVITFCKIREFFNLTMKFVTNETRVEFFKEIGNNMYNNAEKFREGTTKFVRRRTLEGRLELIGTISSAILNIILD